MNTAITVIKTIPVFQTVAELSCEGRFIERSNCIFKRWIRVDFAQMIENIVIMVRNVVLWMGSPAWFLLAWLVVAAGSAWKFWRLTGAYRAKVRSTQVSSSQFRQRLEQSWQRDGENRNDLNFR